MAEWILCAAVLLLFCVSSLAEAQPDERPAVRAWAGSVLYGEPPAEEAPPGIGLQVRRQDYGPFGVRQSVMNTPLQVGQKRYEHGLGTHSVSELVVRLPRPGRRFEAEVGIDNNASTGGVRGSVLFAVEVGGREVFRSDVRRGGQAPLPVQAELNGAREFTLRVLDDGDGPGWDQSDWADAAVVYEDGARQWLDALPVHLPAAKLATDPPFAFVYGGKPSSELLPGWKRVVSERREWSGRTRRTITYADPATGLEVVCEGTVFSDYPAVEWVLYLRNTGLTDTPLIEGIRPLSLHITAPAAGDIALNHAYGSTCAPTDFLPLRDALAPNADIKMAPNGGRSSDGALPFFNLTWHDGGLVGAIGWSGQWEMRLRRDAGRELTLEAGQQITRLKLHPGESIRTPRVLLVFWRGDDPLRGNNLLRRVILAYYSPRHNGEVIMPPITQNTWFTFNSGNDVTEANQLEAMRPMPEMGVEGYWLDAGWFEGGWPSGAGSWVPKKEAFPQGLKPLGDAAHAKGMKFVAWFEPERVNAASRIAREHPEWVLHAGAGDGLYNLGNPAAREWMASFLSRCISEWGIDIYRNDFNIPPLPFWQAADAPDRQGMTEIRYVEGLYALWDELRLRHPDLAIDNCSGGGRRIDLETLSRSFPLWHSDTQCCGRAMPTQDQMQTAGLSQWVPLHAAGAWDFDPYDFRSVATTGASLCMDTRAKGYPVEKARRALDEVKALRPLWLGDFYPLMDIVADERQWCAWQLDRPDLGQGFAMAFRRPSSPYTSAEVRLRGLEPASHYDVTFVDTKVRRVMSGSELVKLRVEIANPSASALITYRKTGR